MCAAGLAPTARGNDGADVAIAEALLSPAVLTTERLQFFRFTRADLPLMVELHSDPEVQRRLGGEWSAAFIRAKLDELIRDDE
jgi:hypothetical protein